MRLTSILTIIIALVFFNSTFSLAQCTISSCPNPAISSGNATWTNGIEGMSNGFISVSGITLGNIDCLTGEAGLEIYIYQLLPDGSRMSLCNVANPTPDNFIFKFPIGVGSVSDCSDTAFPLPDQVFFDHSNNGTNSGMYLCEGGVYEVILAVYVNDTGIPISSEQSVFSVLNPNQYVEQNIGTFFVNYTNEFSAPNPFPIPNSTATITGPNGETETMMAACSTEVVLFIEALSYIGRCRVERSATPDFFPFCDPLDPNMTTGIYSPSIESELENFLSYTINGGSPVIIREGNSGDVNTAAYGGQQTGPGNLPGLGATECYTGLCGARPFPVPDSMCAGDVMVVTLETFDVYTNTTVSDEMTINFTGEGCNDCGPICPSSASITTSADLFCDGDLLTITGNTTGEGAANFTITESTGTIVEIEEGVAFALPTNPTCAPVTYTFNATATCADDESIITDGTKTVNVVVYPSNINNFITANDGECITSISIDASCGDNITVNPESSQIADAGTSGTHTYTISWTGGGPNCIDDFDVTANYNCPPDILCPSSASITTSADLFCDGDLLTITGNTTGEGAANFTITESTGTIVEIEEGVAFALPTNPTCAPVTYTFNATATCADDESIITDGTKTVNVVVYPSNINNFITANDGECITSISIDASCGDNITVNPESSQIADAGTSGTHTYTISWTGGGPNCIDDFDVTANYNCPSICPSEASISTATNAVCGGDMVTITGITIGNGTASFAITENTGTITNIIPDTPIEIPENNTCQAITYTFTASVICEADGSPIVNGTLSLNIVAYPSNITSLITTVENGCTTEVIIDESCAGNILVEPASTQTAEQGDDEGTHTYTISWVADDFGCIADQNISLNYTCSCIFEPPLAGVRKVGGNEPLNKVCYGESISYNATYNDMIIDLDDGGIDIGYLSAFVIFIEPIDFVTAPTNNQIQRITNDTILYNDGSIAPGKYYIHYFQARDTLNPVIDTANCTLISQEYCEIAILEELVVESTTCTGFENNNQVVISISGGDIFAPPSDVYLSSNGTEFDPVSIETTADTTRVITFSNLPDGDYMFFYEDAAACKESLLLEFSCLSSEFDCPSEILTTNFDACTTEIVALTANVLGASDFTIINWFDADGNIVADPTNVQLPVNNTCAPINVVYSIEVSCTQDPNFVTLSELLTISVYPTDVSAFVTPVESECEALLLVDNSCNGLITFEAPTFNPGESGTVDLTVNYANSCVNPFAVSVNYNCPAIMGCTDACAPNYNTNAMQDDGTCEAYDDTCNQDCTLGNFGGTWDAETCSCINEITPVNGCTDMNACNYNATANCNDDSCDFGNAACADTCNEPNPDDGCDLTTDSFDVTTCTVTNEPDCADGTIFNASTCNCDAVVIMGCTDACAPNFNELANEDDGTCEAYDDTCNQDCTLGNFGGTWDTETCSCINEITPVNGCTDMNACNYNATANCNDDSCDFGNAACTDPCNEPNPDDGCDLTTDSFDATTCSITNEPDCADGTTFNASTCNCDAVVIMGCTDACAPNFNNLANMDDGTCEAYDDTCNQDCTLGNFGGTWDAETCSCINEITPVNGCTDMNACNYNATANCNDDSCDFGNTACADPCNEPNPDDGCDLTTDSFDATTCTVTNEPNCADGTIFNASTCNCDAVVIMGCTDACAPNFNNLANMDDGTCEAYDDTCNQDCTLGNFGGTWDAETCSCINEITPVNGCTDMSACNYNATANCNDDSCDFGNAACADPCNEPDPDDGCDLTTDSFDVTTCTVTNEPNCADGTIFNTSTCNCDAVVIMGCTDACAPNFNNLANMDDGTCEAYDDTCNQDCTLGNFGGTWDAETCSCINEITPVNGCTDMNACNYNATANCNDDSCDFGNTACADPCNEPNPDDGCDLTTDSFDATTCTVTNEPNCADGTIFNASTCNCDAVVIMGCTDACAPNFNNLANMDDGTCEAYDDTCNQDCTLGNFGGTWDAETCSCINEITPVNGCTDMSACNYNATANCNDDSCDFGNAACADPCNEPDPDDGCDLTTDSFDVTTCTVTNEPNCADGTIFNTSTCNCDAVVIMGCTDACAPNFNNLANMDDGTCEAYDDTCNQDCTLGNFGGTWDAETCSCINEITPVNGCTDMNACNYNAAANCNDDSCDFGNAACADPCNEPNPDDGCDITTDTYDNVNCIVINTPNCPDNTIFNASTCNCDAAAECTPPAPGVFECD